MSHSPDTVRSSVGIRIATQVLSYLVVAWLAYHLVSDVYDRTPRQREFLCVTLIGSVAFIRVIAAIVRSYFLNWKRRGVLLSIVVFAYVGSYILLSAAGNYHFSQSGHFRYNGGSGLAFSDLCVWHPRFVHWEPFVDIRGTQTSRGSVLGYFFSPLIRLDRRTVHPTRQLIAIDDIRDASD